MTRQKVLVLAALLVLVAAACANEPAPKSTGAPSPTATETEPQGYEHLARAEAGEFSGTEVEILAQWVEGEAAGFEAALADFEQRTGIDINYEGLTDYEAVLNVRVEGDNAPDLAQIPQPGLMRQFADDGKLVALSDFINVEQLQEDYIQSFLDLATYNGKIYGVFYRANLKSIVWYPVQAFADHGYQVPTTWDELVALSNQIVADGNGNPWCISIEHGEVSGWVATDWLEDILLRTAPVEIYDQWMNHQIPFNHPEVLEAAEYMQQIWFAPDFVYGGATGINGIWVGDTQTPMFDPAGPKCWMHKQAAWIPAFWPKDPATEEPLYEPGVDSAFFYFPPIEEEYGRPVLGAGDQFVMFNDRPEVRAVIEFLATPEAALGWVEAGGFVSANRNVPASAYTTYPDSDLAKIMTEATTLRFDASDFMPAEGAGTFLAEMVKWVSHEGQNTEQVFQRIETSWPNG